MFAFMLHILTGIIHYCRVPCCYRGLRLGLRWGCWYVPSARPIVFTISNN